MADHTAFTLPPYHGFVAPGWKIANDTPWDVKFTIHPPLPAEFGPMIKVGELTDDARSDIARDA